MGHGGIAQRRRVPEVMDDPRLDSRRHAAALAGLARLNTASASARILWAPIANLARDLHATRLRVLDVATGGGDIPRALWRRAARAGIDLDIHGIDVSEQAVQIAREQAEVCRIPLQFSQRDALADELPAGFDVIVSSLFLHHLDQPDAERLLGSMARAARHLVVIQDLRRCRSGLALAHLAGRVLTRSEVVRVDAPRSVRAAFTLDEAQVLAASAGLPTATIRRCWPCRFLLTWRKSPAPISAD